MLKFLTKMKPSWLVVAALLLVVILFEPTRSSAIGIVSLFPAVIWSAFVASAITLLGVHLSNRGNTDRLMKQLRVDTTQKELARKFEVRREVYLEATKNIVEASRCIGDLPNLYDDQNADEGLNGLQDSVAKITLIGDADAMMAALELSAAVHMAFTALHQSSMPARHFLGAIRTAKEAILKETKFRDALIERAGLANENRALDSVKHNIIADNLISSNDVIKHWEKEIAQNSKARRSAMAQFHKEFEPFRAKINAAQTKLLIAIRTELGMENDHPKLLAFFQENIPATEEQAE